MLLTDFQKNRQKIPILYMLNLRLTFPVFSEMGLSTGCESSILMFIAIQTLRNYSHTLYKRIHIMSHKCVTKTQIVTVTTLCHCVYCLQRWTSFVRQFVSVQPIYNWSVTKDARSDNFTLHAIRRHQNFLGGSRRKMSSEF